MQHLKIHFIVPASSNRVWSLQPWWWQRCVKWTAGTCENSLLVQCSTTYHMYTRRHVRNGPCALPDCLWQWQRCEMKARHVRKWFDHIAITSWNEFSNCIDVQTGFSFCNLAAPPPLPKIKLQSLHFSRPHAITIFKVYIQFLTRLWQGVQLDQVAVHSTGATSFSTPPAIYILLSICIYLPSPAPICARQFRPWWDRLTFGLTPSLSDSLILPSLRSIPNTFQPTQPQLQNHT